MPSTCCVNSKATASCWLRCRALLAEIFTMPWLKAIFPVVLRGLDRTGQKATALAQDLRPVIPAVTETIEAGMLSLDIRTDGQHPDERPGAWYNTPRLYLLVTGQDLVVPYGWETFSELLGLLTLHARNPEALTPGYQGGRVMFSPPGNVTPEGFFGIDGLRIFLSAEDLETLGKELTMKCYEGLLAEALIGLRCL